MLTAREPFYRVGGDFSFNYHAFNLFGQYLYGRDQNLLPLLPAGFLPPPTGLLRGSPASFSGGFLEADYLPLPWLMTIMRWDAVHSTADLIQRHRSDARHRHRIVRVALPRHTKSLYARCAVSDSRQYQGVLRIPDPAAADCLRPDYRHGTHWSVPYQLGDCGTGIRLLDRGGHASLT